MAEENIGGKSSREKRSVVHVNFTTKTVDGKEFSVCNVSGCTARYKVNRQSTSNLLTHIRMKHPELLNASNSPQAGGSQTTLETSFMRTFKQDVYEEKLVNFIAEANVSFRTTELSSFKDLVLYLNPKAKCISADTATAKLKEKFEVLRKAKMEAVASIKSKISFATDCWSGKNNKQFSTIAASYITEDWELVTTILDFAPIKGQHTGSRLCEAFEEVVRRDFQITNKTHGKITLDNASNNNLMIALYCKKHDLQLDIHIQCADHSINLAVKLALNVFKSAIDKFRNYVRAIRFSPLLTERLENLYMDLNGSKTGFLMVQLDSPTRWGSTAAMLKVGVDVKNEKMQEPLKVSKAFCYLKNSGRSEINRNGRNSN